MFSAINWSIIGTVLAVIAIILLVLLVALYFWGRKLEKNQAEQQAMIQANTQIVPMLVIDKKKMKIKDAVAAGLPQIVLDNTPAYLKWAKLPVVKCKVGPRVMTLIADEKVFSVLPIKTECKCAVSGLYITEIKSVRGGKLEAAPKKTGFFAKLRDKAAAKTAEMKGAQQDTSKKSKKK